MRFLRRQAKALSSFIGPETDSFLPWKLPRIINKLTAEYLAQGIVTQTYSLFGQLLENLICLRRSLLSAKTNGYPIESDTLTFTEEPAASLRVGSDPWKILIADDDDDVHVATKLVLKEFSFKGRLLEFFHAYTGVETCELLQQNPDIAVIFLDVVMETPDAGLRAVKRIRDDMSNKDVRIILRTGHPGLASEDAVVGDYEINDYKTKSEMTSLKLHTSIITALRSYRDIVLAR